MRKSLPPSNFALTTLLVLLILDDLNQGFVQDVGHQLIREIREIAPLKWRDLLLLLLL